MASKVFFSVKAMKKLVIIYNFIVLVIGGAFIGFLFLFLVGAILAEVVYWTKVSLIGGERDYEVISQILTFLPIFVGASIGFAKFLKDFNKYR